MIMVWICFLIFRHIYEGKQTSVHNSGVFVYTNLIEYLLNAYVNHQRSCTKVVGKLKAELKDKFAVGIIDKGTGIHKGMSGDCGY